MQGSVVTSGVLLAVVMQQSERPTSRRKRRREARKRGAQGRRGLKPSVILQSIFTLALSGLIVLIMRTISSETLLATRSFYGVSRVWEINTARSDLRAYQLTHGKTVHGFQFEASDRRSLPTTFYAENSRVGLAISNHPSRPGGLRVGALGLGIGVIASYGQPGDVYRFYEIAYVYGGAIKEVLSMSRMRRGDSSGIPERQALRHVR